MLSETSRNDGSKFMILGNHTSFFDTVLACSSYPMALMAKCRTYYATALLKIPIIGYINKTMGHFPVYFKSNVEGKFAVDREKMKITQAEVSARMAEGCVLSFYPEGSMNRNPDKLLPFRYGGMKVALANDAKIFMLVMYGNQDMWPMKAKVGGFPGVGRYHFGPLAPQGCRQLVEELRKQANPQYDGTAPDPDDAPKLLGNYFQAEMQKIYNQLKKEVKGSDLTDE